MLRKHDSQLDFFINSINGFHEVESLQKYFVRMIENPCTILYSIDAKKNLPLSCTQLLFRLYSQVFL